MAQYKRLRRNRYFDGKMLSAEDFEREQEYNLDRHRRNNRFLHGWGIVDGLGISIEQGKTVVVSPGLAIDCAGNEIVVEAEERLPITASAHRLYVVIRYQEIPVDPEPRIAGKLDESATEFSRILESACIELASEDPGANHRGMGRGTPGCGQAHPLRLGLIRRHGTRWRRSR